MNMCLKNLCEREKGMSEFYMMILNIHEKIIFSGDGCDGEEESQKSFLRVRPAKLVQADASFVNLSACSLFAEEVFLASAEPIHQRVLPLLSFPRAKTRMNLAKSRKSNLFDMECLPQL